MRLLLPLLPLLAGGCTINLIRKPAESVEPKILSRQMDFYKWLYDRGISRGDPQMLRLAALKLLDIKVPEAVADGGGGDSGGGGGGDNGTRRVELLERTLLRLEHEIDRLTKDRAKE
jgi:hypothetical protein